MRAWSFRSAACKRPAVVLLAWVCAATSSCASLTPEAAHAKFVHDSRAAIGQNIDTSNYTNLQRASRISEESLASGLLRYRYRAGKGCVAVYDVDPGTRIIVDFSYEGTREQCAYPL